MLYWFFWLYLSNLFFYLFLWPKRPNTRARIIVPLTTPLSCPTLRGAFYGTVQMHPQDELPHFIVNLKIVHVVQHASVYHNEMKFAATRCVFIIIIM